MQQSPDGMQVSILPLRFLFLAFEDSVRFAGEGSVDQIEQPAPNGLGSQEGPIDQRSQAACVTERDAPAARHAG